MKKANLKKCPTCGIIRNVVYFYKNKTTKDRLSADCKICYRTKINLRNARKRLAAKKLKDAPPRVIRTSDPMSPVRLKDGTKVLPCYFADRTKQVRCDSCISMRPVKEFTDTLTFVRYPDGSEYWTGVCNFCLAAEASKNNVAGMLGVRKPVTDLTVEPKEPKVTFPPQVEFILDKRYFFKGQVYENYYGHPGKENWNELASRVASVVCKDDPVLEAASRHLILDRKFIPNSPTLFGAGIPGLTLSACFVIGMEDSIPGWIKTFSNAIRVQVSGGGCGFPIYKLRPHGFPVRKTNAKAAGPVDFLTAADSISLTLNQAVRSGANIGLLTVSHPDIRAFINAKNIDGKLSAFNLSVAITDKFMDCVKHDAAFDLEWEGKVIETVSAVKLWDEICEHAHRTGEPGIIFFDSFNRGNHYRGVVGDLLPNPCMHPDTPILTAEYGIAKIGELVGKECHTFDFNGIKRKVTKVWCSGNKPIVELITKCGFTLKCTPDHRIMTSNGWYCEAKEMQGKDIKFSEPDNEWSVKAISRHLDCPISDLSYDAFKVIEVKDAGTSDVYEFSQPDTNCASVCGLIVSNCGEASLFEDTACNLGSMNLSKYQEGKRFLHATFNRDIKIAYSFLDSLIDVNNYPTKEIEEKVKKYRQIGLGIMGLADVFIKANIAYGSEESLELTKSIMTTFSTTVKTCNASLGQLKDNYPGKTPADPRKHARNFTSSCVAPTGTISQIAECSSGVEPVFSFEPMRRQIAGTEHIVPYHLSYKDPSMNVSANDIPVEDHVAVTAMVQAHIDMSVSKTINLPSSATVQDVKRAYELAYKSGLKGITVYRDNSRENQTLQHIAKTTTEINQDPGADLQLKAWSKSIDDQHGTKPDADPNNPEHVEEIRANIFKGLRQNLPEDLAKAAMGEVSVLADFHPYDSITPLKRPEALIGYTQKYKIGCGSLYVTVNYEEATKKIIEIFVRPGKYGGCSSNVEALGRLASLALRTGAKISEVIDYLKGIRCMSCSGKKDIKVLSCSDAVGKTLAYQYARSIEVPQDYPPEEADPTIPTNTDPDLTEVKPPIQEQPITRYFNICPACGVYLVHEGGCKVCKACGWSKCG
jgi:ribonucleotide reductase alpha subunit